MRDLDDEMIAWIAGHSHLDPMRLRLSHHGEPGIDQAILQIECRRRVARKLPELSANPHFLFPSLISTEQCTSESLAALHVRISGCREGSRVFDMTAGLGIDAIAHARAGAKVTAADIVDAHAHALMHNASVLGLEERLSVRCADSVELLRDMADDAADVIFIDPARRSIDGTQKRVYRLADTLPDPVSLMPEMLRVAPTVIVKASPMLDLHGAAAELGASELHVTGNATECSEVVAVVRRQGIEEPTVTVHTPDRDTLTLPLAEVGKAPDVHIAVPLPGMILIEPHPAVMKAAPWQMLCRRYGIRPVHSATHLFISDCPVPGIPARQYRLLAVTGAGGREVKELVRRWPKANVAVRNYPGTAPELVRRLKIKEGGDIRLIGCTTTDTNGRDKLTLLVGEPI